MVTPIKYQEPDEMKTGTLTEDTKEHGILGLWDPDKFTSEVKYMLGKHMDLVETFVKAEFPNNAAKIII